MAAYDQSDPGDSAHNVRRVPETRRPSGDPRAGSVSSPREGNGSEPEQLSEHDLAVILGYSEAADDAVYLDASALLACPKLVRLQSILENQDLATAGERRHIAVCPDCVARVRAFRRMLRRDAADLFENTVDLIRTNVPPFSPHLQDAEGHARLMFLMITQDADPERWQSEAWACTRKIPAALRIAQNGGATRAELEVVIELFLTAIGAAASNAAATCSRTADGAWPIVEMVKHTAIEVASNAPYLFTPFARALGSAIRLASRRMKVMLVYAMVDLVDRGAIPAVFAPTLIREISACDVSDSVRVVLATLLHSHRTLPADVRSAVSDAWSDPRGEEVFKSIARARHSLDVALQATRTSTSGASAAVLAIVERFRDDLFDAAEPEDAILRLITLRRVLAEIAGRHCGTETELFRSIARLLLESADQRRGSTFLALEACSVILDVCPAAFQPFAAALPTARFIVRQGMFTAIADAWAAVFAGSAQTTTPGFIRQGSGWRYERGAFEHPLDGLCLYVAELSFTADLHEHFRWLRHRLDIWNASAEAGVITI